MRFGREPELAGIERHFFPLESLQLFGSVTAIDGDPVFRGGTNDRNFRPSTTDKVRWEQTQGIMGMPVVYEVDRTEPYCRPIGLER